MVQERDAAKKRVERRRDFLAREAKRLEDSTLGFRWAVVEHTPGYNTGGYYDEDIKPRNVIVSEYFNTKEEAEAWMDAHEPDKGNTLKIRRERLVKREYTEWVSY